MALVFVDTETTGLDASRHEIWEAAYAVNGGPIRSSLMIHNLVGADPKALEVGHYEKRCLFAPFHPVEAIAFERDLREVLVGSTLVAANPAFDAKFLEARWGVAPWRYRLLDVEAYAMGALAYKEPRGLKDIRADLVDAFGFDIPAPDHSAAADVATLQAVYFALRKIYDRSEMHT